MNTTYHWTRQISPTGARNKNSWNSNWLANMSTKYTVASRRMASKRLGKPGYLFAFDLLTVVTRITNASMSTIPQRGWDASELPR